ncbi:MAG: hypothetical protein V1767_02865 [Chloroflexota bacterium]
MANKDNPATEELALDVQQVKKRLDVFDQRLDNIDSMVSAVAERIMNQPITLYVTCPHCGKEIEVAILGTRKPRR